jgi:hypothetical protein
MQDVHFKQGCLHSRASPPKLQEFITRAMQQHSELPKVQPGGGHHLGTLPYLEPTITTQPPARTCDLVGSRVAPPSCSASLLPATPGSEHQAHCPPPVKQSPVCEGIHAGRVSLLSSLQQTIANTAAWNVPGTVWHQLWPCVVRPT